MELRLAMIRTRDKSCREPDFKKSAMASRGIERDEDLTLFHEMQKRDHERRNIATRHISDNAAATVEVHSARFASSSLYKSTISGTMANIRRVRTAGEELLASDMGKNDYDWLLTPPGTPLTIVGSENDPISAKKGMPNLVRSLAAIKTTRLSSSESSAKTDLAVRSSRSNPTHVLNRRSSLAPACLSTPSSRPASRPSTPNRPISSSTATGSTRTVLGSSTTRSGVSSRPTTPLRRPSPPILSHTNSQPMASVGGRSSSASKASSSLTPLRKPSTPTLSQAHSQLIAGVRGRSSSASKVNSLPSRSTPVSGGSSPTVRSRASEPSTMPEFSLGLPPNLRTSVPNRSVSNTRGASINSTSSQSTGTTLTIGLSRQGASLSSLSMPSTNFSKSSARSSPSRPVRPGASLLLSTGLSMPVSFSSSVKSSLMSKVSSSLPSPPTTSRMVDDPPPEWSRRQSRSPSITRGRTPTTERHSSPYHPAGRGSKIVDPMIPSRRAAALSLSPEKLQVKRATKPDPIAKDNAGYGKAMSRNFIDMALRNMDIPQSASNGLRPLVSNMPSSSFYTVRSVNRRGGGVRPGHSPLTTSSTASSEYSMSIVRDLEDDVGSEIGSRASPRSVQDCMLSVAKEARVIKWVDSGEFTSDELMHMFRKRKGNEKASVLDSPTSVCCPHHLHGRGGPGSCDLCNLKSRMQSLRGSPMLTAESVNLSSYCGSSNGVPSPSSSLL